MEAPIIKNKDNLPFIHQYNFDNLNYEIELNNNNNKLFIKATNKSKVENSFFFYEEAIENIYKLDRYFMVFENIEEIKNNIIEILKENECIQLKLSKENELKLIIKTLVGKQIKYIEFTLTKKEANNENLINILIDKINSLEKENEIMKNKIKDLEDLFSEEIKEKKQLKNYIIGDSISTINRIQDYFLLRNGIYSQLNELKGKIIKLKLIFKSSRDGNTSEDFHKFCDGKGPTISVIKTKENNVFGGFLNIQWKSEGEGHKDNKAFLFSFKKNKIYKNNGKGNAGFFLKECGPNFSYGINIKNNFNESNRHRVRNKYDSECCWTNIASDFELNDGIEYFDIEEIEIFEVIIE